MKPSKKCYAAIDLHSNNLFIAVVDSEGRRLAHARLFCELHEVDKFLRRRKARIEAVAVESTFNWYWLVDGLRALNYNVVLANPAGIAQYDGLKHADDRSDAFFLAELLRLGRYCPPATFLSRSCGPSAICCGVARRWCPSGLP